MRADPAVVSEKRIHFRYALVVIALLLAMALLQQRIDELNRADAFYRWLLARETRLELGGPGVAEAEQEENDFFDRVRAQGSMLASKRWPAVTDIVSEDVAPEQKWDVVRSEEFQDLRIQFTSLLREGKLTGVKGAVEWQEQGVGQHLGALILGFRTAVADLIWLKVDEYWHQGNLHRMLPAMYTVVRLDPHFIDAYSVGAWHLAYNAVVAVHTEEEKRRYTEEAIEFLKDGIEKNPFHYQLYFDLGFAIYFQKLKDYPNAVKYLELANRYDPPRWCPRMLLLAYEKNGQFETALAGWKRYLEQYPDNWVGPRVILELQAMIAARDGDEDRARALWQQVYDQFPGVNDRADFELTKIDAIRAERAGHDETALELWYSLVSKTIPMALDEALDNARRLHKKLGLPPIREGDMGLWDVRDAIRARGMK